MAARWLKQKRKVALLEGISAGAFFGTAAVLIRLLGGMGADVFYVTFWRLAIASAVLTVTICLLKQPFNVGLLKRFFVQVLFLGVLLGLHFVLFISAVMDTTVINATVLVNTTPIWSLLVSVLILGVKPARFTVLGSIISFVGVSIIASADVTSPALSSSLKGDIEALLAAVAEAFYLSYGRDVRRKSPILSLMTFIYVMSTLVVLVASVVVKSAPIFSTVNLEMVLVLLGLGILPTALAHTLYFSSLSSLKPFETATLALLEPIAATLLGVLVFTEIPGALFVVGAVLVLGGVISVARRG